MKATRVLSRIIIALFYYYFDRYRCR